MLVLVIFDVKTSLMLVGFVMTNANISSRSDFVRVNAYMLQHYEEFEFELTIKHVS